MLCTRLSFIKLKIQQTQMYYTHIYSLMRAHNKPDSYTNYVLFFFALKTDGTSIL